MNRISDGLLPDIEARFGSAISAFMGAFADRFDPRAQFPGNTYATITGTQGEMLHFLLIQPDFSVPKDWLHAKSIASALWRAVMEAAEERLPDLWPYFAVVQFRDDALFFNFLSEISGGGLSVLQEQFRRKCQDEFGISVQARYIWTDENRMHFRRIGRIEV